MKSIIFALFLIINIGTLQAEDANALFSRRGEDKMYAFKAAQEFRKLFEQETNILQKAKYKVSEAKAIFYYGTKLPDKPKKTKLRIFKDGMDAASVAANLLEVVPGVAQQHEWRETLARAYYWRCANLGKWAETKGILSSLGKWKKLKRNLNYIINLDQSHVEEWGAYRILGRAYMAIPYESNNKALMFLKTAYENTLVTVAGITIANNPITVAFYLEILKEQDEEDTFCEVYEAFVDLSESDDEIIIQYNPDLVPETKFGFKVFHEHKKLRKYYDNNC